jgi:hypothetical protein
MVSSQSGCRAQNSSTSPVSAGPPAVTRPEPQLPGCSRGGAAGVVERGAHLLVAGPQLGVELLLTMTMDKAYSHNWFVYNELSQITPMPTAWDRTASGPSHCTTTVSDCAAVYNYLNDQAKDLSTYTTNPLWGVVDGPFKLIAFNSDGHLTMVPNKSYSGPVKPKLSEFQEVPSTTDAAEYDVLRSPSTSTKIDVGYIPTQNLPAKPVSATVGRNPLPGTTWPRRSVGESVSTQ